ncbi:hypothetical protein DYZ97_04875 [Apilactobacillus timberlakei]|nr:hypothetical protein DYZ97_04875 [Apilactobacillus timberlakei]
MYITFLSIILILVGLYFVNQNKENKSLVNIYNDSNKLEKVIKNKKSIYYISQIFGDSIGKEVGNKKTINLPNHVKKVCKIELIQSNSNDKGSFDLYENGYAVHKNYSLGKTIVWKLSQRENNNIIKIIKEG